MHLEVASLVEKRQIGERVKTHALAYHYLAAKDKERALKWGLAAARDSLRTQANREAASYYNQLLALSPDSKLRTELLMDYGQALAGMADPDAIFSKSVDVYAYLKKPCKLQQIKGVLTRAFADADLGGGRVAGAVKSY